MAALPRYRVAGLWSHGRRAWTFGGYGHRNSSTLNPCMAEFTNAREGDRKGILVTSCVPVSLLWFNLSLHTAYSFDSPHNNYRKHVSKDRSVFCNCWMTPHQFSRRFQFVKLTWSSECGQLHQTARMCWGRRSLICTPKWKALNKRNKTQITLKNWKKV